MKKNFITHGIALMVLFAGLNVKAGNVNLISAGTDWKYLDNGTDQGTSWTAPAFNDASWATGAGQLGYGDGDEATVVSFGPDAANKYITTYFRKTISVTNPSQFKTLYVALVCDDGAMVYVNGTEAVRYNLPAGPVNYMTEAINVIDGHFENTYYYFAIDPSLLVAGNNTIAVEVHQQRPNSSDVSFNFQLIASTEARLIYRGDTWKYFDQGIDQGTSWRTVGFNDAAWANGKAILGYNSTAGSRVENTTVSFGASSSNKYPTTYFRKTITIADINQVGDLSFNLFIDDGAVIYVNGVEAARINMPTGTISYSTLANVTVGGTGSWITQDINRTLFQTGVNEIAIEAHQVTAGSSDKVMEFELQEKPTPPAPGGGCTSTHVGCFTSVSGSCQSGNMVIPSTHTFQYIMAQGDAYSHGGGNMPTNNDFTGFLSTNGSSELGKLMVNHENTVGGVSMIEMHFDPYTGLWVRDSARAINFSGVNGTNRNCSGGISQWGTTFTCEETTSSTDGNGDGYFDYGWHVEIDPVTKRPKDYNNDGTPDKVWAMGLSKKENLVVASDKKTVYFGLDDSNFGFVYKFIADQPENMSSGTLWVLVKSSLLAPTGTWVQVPNTTQADRNNSQSLANGLGARNFIRVEDVEIGPDGMIYFTATTDGRVYRFTDNGSTISNFEIYIDRTNYTYATSSGTQSTLFEWPDNLAFDAQGNLWINCDGGCSNMWMARNGHSMSNPQMELFMRTPNGSESTGTTFSPDGRFMFLSIQHPSSGNSLALTDAAGNNIVINKATTLVLARKEDLGPLAAIPFVNLGPAQTACQGQTVTLNAGTHSAYLWNTGATTPTINVNTSGTYSVTVTGSNGRTNTASVQVTINTAPTVSVSTTTVNVCAGQSVTLNATSSASLSWNNGISNGVAFIPSTGTTVYTVTATDANSCTATATASVTSNALPIVTASANNNTVCAGTPVTLTGGGASTYTWNNGVNNNVAFVPTATQTYTVTGIDANNCQNTTTVTVTVNTLPVVIANASSPSICAGAQVTLTSSGAATLNWDNGVTEGLAFSPSATQTYTVTGTDANNCQNTASVTVTVNALPAVTASASSTSVCEGGSVTLNGNGASNYAWDNGVSNNVSFVPAATQTYTVTGTDANNCQNTASISVTVNALPVVSASASDIAICAGESVILNGNGANSYSWDNGVSNNVSFVPNATQTYTVTGTDANNCQNTASISVTVNALPTVSISGLNATYVDTDGNVTMIGSPAGGTFSGNGVSGNSFSPSMAGAGTHTITYTFTDANGCTGSNTFNVTVSTASGLNELGENESFMIYPNPFTNEINVRFDLIQGSEVIISITDITGKVMHNEQRMINSGTDMIRISGIVETWSKGVYLIHIRKGEITKTVQLIKN